MPFIPHTENEIQEMLAAIGASSIEDLFDEIPADLRYSGLDAIPEGLNEMQVSRLMQTQAAKDGNATCFIGAGAYEHHIPAAVWELTTRGEFYSAYTPYQAEASQGTLQLIYEYQTIMTRLTGMDASNASMYDGASSLAESILMAIRANRKSKSRTILVAGTTNPTYHKVADAIVANQNINLVDLEFDQTAGTTPLAAFEAHTGEDIAAVVIQQPSFFGTLEDVNAITDWAHAQGALVIAVVNPTSLGLLTEPGQWGETGADIVCGDGQPMGAPLSSGGPYFGFMCCKQAYVRQMPGRIVGRTVDLEGKEGFALTLQAREQHIRRSKATSNICTNQGLLVTAATIHMSLLGPKGLESVAANSHANTVKVRNALTAIDGVEQAFSAPFFHEVVITLPKPVDDVLLALAEKDILGGYSLAEHNPELGNALLVCATEVRTEEDIAAYAAALQEVLA